MNLHKGKNEGKKYRYGLIQTKNILSDIVGITHLARNWTSPNGMLGSNKLLSKEQIDKLNLWVDIIQESLMWLLDDAPEEAFWSYEMYLKGES